MIGLLTILGLAIAIGTLAAIIWSTVVPHQRIWPPQSYRNITPILVWTPTFTLFGILIALGIMEWGEVALPHWLRFWLGIPFLIVANVGVWYEVIGFGITQTGGAKGKLKTTGLYRYSRNPQYIADSLMIVSWLLLSASPMVLLVGVAAIIVLLVAPLPEEIWLHETYGEEYARYASTVPRYF